MTTSTTEPGITYGGDGSTTTFAIPFDFTDSSEIKVELIANSTNAVTLQTDPGEYSISGTDVEMVTPPSATETLVITLSVSESQITNYIEGDAFPAETHEAALDKLTRLYKQIKYIIDHNVLQLPSNRLINPVIPGTQIGAAKVVRINAAGDSFELATVNSITDGGDAWGDPVDDNILPDTDSTYNIGASGNEFNTVYADTLYGTLATAAQPNITSLGTLTALTVDNITLNGNSVTTSSGNLTVTPAGVVDLSAKTSHVLIPRGTTAQRTGVSVGELRFNTTDNKLEVYTGSAWTQLVGAGAPGSWSTAIDSSLSFDTDSTYDMGTNLVRGANLYFDTLYGVIATAAQPNITSLGTLTTLTVDNITINGNDISSGAGDITFTPTGVVNLSGLTNHILLPKGTTGQRTATTGNLRFNTTDNKLEYYNGSSWHQLTEGSTGGLVLIATASASASATVDFDNFLNSTYDTYMVTVDSMVVATDNALAQLRIGTGAGPTYQSGVSDYAWGAMYTGSTVGGTYDTADSSIRLSGSGSGLGNATGEHFNGVFYIHNPSNSSLYTYVSGTASYGRFDNYTSVATTAGRYLSNTAVTSIRFLMSSGNITSGTFKLYGIKKS